MKIDGNSLPPLPPSPNQARPKGEDPGVSQNPSSYAAAATQAAGQSQATRSARLAAIKEALANGSYKADPSRIADGILDSATLDAALNSATKD